MLCNKILGYKKKIDCLYRLVFQTYVDFFYFWLHFTLYKTKQQVSLNKVNNYEAFENYIIFMFLVIKGN